MKTFLFILGCLLFVNILGEAQATDAPYYGGFGDGQSAIDEISFSVGSIDSYSPFFGGQADGTDMGAVNNYSGLSLAFAPFHGAAADGSATESSLAFTSQYISMFNPFAGAVGDGGQVDSLVTFNHDYIRMYGPFTGTSKNDGSSHDSLINFMHDFIRMYGPFAGGAGDGWTGHLVIGVSLPVELLEFYGEKREGDHWLHWTVGEEINLSHYELHHSADGKRFEKLNSTTPAVSSGHNEYFSIHKKPNFGNNYYRLKILDRDGTYEWSNTVLLHEDGVAELSVYPNPVQGDLTLDIRSNPDILGRAVLLTMDGKIIHSFDVAEGDTKLHIPMSALPSAHYILLFQNRSERKVFKIAKE